MSYGVYLSTAGMQANEYRQAIVANNLANAETHGFKHDLAVIAERPVAGAGRSAGGPAPWGAGANHAILKGLSGGLTVRPTYHSFAQGPLETTGRPLDAAINGDGFFAVSDGTNIRYTRDGRMTFNAEGELVLVVGEGRWRVLDDAGSTIRRTDSRQPIEITSDGIVQQGEVELARLGLTTFIDKRKLVKEGANLFRANQAEAIPADGRVIGGALERSTFDPIQGLVNMIEVQRAYELNARALTLQDQATGLLISSLPRVA